MKYAQSDIEVLHRKYAPSDKMFELVFTHCRIVYDIAEQLMESGTFDIDTDLVRVGCLLHDIGVYTLFDAEGSLLPGATYITHGVASEAILWDEGFPEAIWRIGSHHTGVGLSKQDVVAENLPLPQIDYLAETDEELLIMYADKFHSKTTPPYFNSYEWYAQDISKFGQHKVMRFERMAQKFGIPNLQPLVTKYGYELR